MSKCIALSLFLIITTTSGFSQNQYVDAYVSKLGNESFGIVKLQRKDQRIKVKYFAAKDIDNTPVYQRYQNWARNKKVVALSSGTYMDHCEVSNDPQPVGLCIDQGNIVNQNLVSGRLDALAIVYATGGIAASNLSESNLSIVWPGGRRDSLDIRGSSLHKTKFLTWAQEVEATVFQTHLFIYKDQIKMGQNSSNTTGARRFLAVCKDDTDQINYYMINLPTAATLMNGVTKAHRILKELEEVKQIVFMINLDTGCQNVFSVFHDDGTEYTDKYLKGNTHISNSINLIAYYYE